MKNIILNGMLEDFSGRHSFVHLTESVVFEKFCNYCVLSNDHYDSFDFEKVETGEALGVDGVAAVIGDAIINRVEDAEYLTRAQFSASFHFIQAKTSPSFDLGEFLKFTATVRKFFQESKIEVPREIHDAFDVKDIIYKKAGKLNALPPLKLWYCYSGDFKIDDKAVLGTIQAEVDALEGMKYRFTDVSLKIADANTLAAMYREAQNNTVGRVSYQRHVALPKMERATAAYIGVMRCKDYVTLIRKANGEINKGIFYENVRDYLGIRNPVNKEIGQTISSEASRNQFAVLNNGVTIVASRVVPSGDTFELHRFQVVNGCQTSHVLFDLEGELSDEMHLTVKLIETSDADLTNEIIRSTNSQSLVMKEALATTRPYHRVLEDYFYALKGEGFKFLYERRPHQFDDVSGVTQDRIVSAPNLMKSFVSVVLEEPHKVHYYYGRLLEEYNTGGASELFSEEHYPGIYYAAHHIASKVRARIGTDHSLKPWAFHIALLIKKDLSPKLVTRVSFTDRSFRELIDSINVGFYSSFDKASNYIRSRKLGKNDNRVPAVTSAIISGFLASAGQEAGAVTGESPTERASPSNRDSKGSIFVDGDFVGRADAIDLANGLIRVKYGASLVDVPAPLDTLSMSKPGGLVRFTRLNGRIVSAELL